MYFILRRACRVAFLALIHIHHFFIQCHLHVISYKNISCPSVLLSFYFKLPTYQKSNVFKFKSTYPLTRPTLLPELYSIPMYTILYMLFELFHVCIVLWNFEPNWKDELLNCFSGAYK